MSATSHAERLKEQGNLYFKKERIAAAIDAYTEAIALSPDVPVYWTNRALCHRKRDDWEKVASDSKRALELDPTSVKGHYMLGLALSQFEQHAEAAKELEKALELGRGVNPTSRIVEEIWTAFSTAKYEQWKTASSARKAKQKEIRNAVERVLQAEYEKAVSDERSGDTVMLDAAAECSEDEDDNQHRKQRQKVEHPEDRLTEAYNEKMQIVQKIFDQAEEPDPENDFQVPQYLCCQITMDIFKDPVITPSGVTYERAVILEHLRKVYLVGRFDPITRAPLEPEQVVSNLAMKEAVHEYMSEHPWTYKAFTESS